LKLLALFLLLFVYSCHGEAPKGVKTSSPTNTDMSALEHLKIARQLLRNEEGHLMVMGRSHTPEEQKRYESLLFAGKALVEMIENLENSELK